MTTTAPAVTGSARPCYLGALTAATALLVTLVALVPFPLASALSGGRYRDLAALRAGVTNGFVQLWATGDGRLGELSATADFWARFHVVKATLSTVLLVVLSILLATVWRASTDAGSRARRWGLALLGVGASGLAVVSLLLVVANLQGAVAPLSSVLGLLSFADPGGPLEPAVQQARQVLGSGASTPAAQVLRGDFARYHAVMAVLGTAVTVALIGVRWCCGAGAPTPPEPSDGGGGSSPREAPDCCCSPEPSPSSLRQTSPRPSTPPPRCSPSLLGAPDVVRRPTPVATRQDRPAHMAGA